jgi:uncharacterized protein
MTGTGDAYDFSWDDLGDLELGRPNLGLTTSVICYRLLEFTFKDVLSKRLGMKETRQVFHDAGHLAGEHFCKKLLNTKLPFDKFIAELEKVLIDLKIGVLRIEDADLEKGTITLTVSEDLDCSGLPIFGETVCDYDEGFLAGILFTYTGRRFNAKEIDCWATGDRTCRFKITE